MKKIFISAVFALLMVPTLASAADVATFDELKAALADTSTTIITLTADITTPEKLLINRPLTIHGAGHVVSFDGNTVGWGGKYVFHVYQTTGVTIDNIKLTGGDAALLVNNSTATLTGAVDVSGNEFGGIESSGATAALTVSGATLTNSSEAYGLPTIWEDAITGTTVLGGSFTESSTIKAGQIQYYLDAVNTTTRHIATVEQLRTAIKSQVDGQTWIIAAGDYGMGRFNDITLEGQAGWYFPITANHLTIIGIGNPVIYGTEFSLNGNWSTQNLISVFGNNVTLKGLTFMPKAEGNKTIEVLGNDVTIEDIVIQPNTKVASSVYDGIPDLADRAFSKEWGGSIYFNHAGNHILKNVTINNGGISFRYSPANTHITFDNVNIVNKTNDDFINGYRFSSGFNDVSNSVAGLPKVTYKVDALTNNLASALLGSKNGDTVELTSDITTLSQVNLSKAVTLDGKGHTLHANFAKTDSSNNSVIGVGTSSVTIKNLIVDGTGGTNLHGINIYVSTDVTLDTVSALNTNRSGIVINGSNVTATNLTTSGNVWNGVNVDPGSGVTTPSIFTLNSGTLAESAQIWSDGANVTSTTTVTVNAPGYNKYKVTGPPAGTLWSNKPSLTSPAVISTSTTTTTVTFSTATDAETTTSAGTVEVEIPAGIVITGPATWNGVFNSPTATTSFTISSESEGFWLTAVVGIAIGGGNIPLTFDQAIKLTFVGQAGKLAGWSQNGQFHKIGTCVPPVPTLAAGSDCAIDDGADLVIWTKHATEFIVYTQTAIPYGGGGGSSSSGGSTGGSNNNSNNSNNGNNGNNANNGNSGNNANTNNNGNNASNNNPQGQVLGVTVTANTNTNNQGQVLGVTKYAFTRSMGLGVRGDDVTELQKKLIAEGHLKLAVPTKYYGILTRAALIKWQVKNGIPATGYFGVLSRAFANK